ncbi:Yih1p NDAI_0I00450 [Naumovozyma dairenensis CBS 421]|uniref:RWD domain-containing protein n=1 Tax=Naumovozyma dairenensis (strain ATCC 10597 / BCRC 20456 / CBS 421 / NBRC 0211 / NRRL Y-12639) TaxID=1071378 RepID=G0WFQ3_NAUDC|nr:hypothetical protein NDAI_0I00450 [Naumovozyma dairenensis CBS 421]CCD26614.1 hypothetical protein NDAI_0I00450 [Naumovozyma dairenensis CBS 421]
MSTDYEDLIEELDTIEAIYPDLLTKRIDESGLIQIKVPQHEYFSLQISFPTHYPSKEPPHLLEISISKKDIPSNVNIELYDLKYLEFLFQEVLDSVHHPGSVCLFDFLTELDGILYIEDEPTTTNGIQQDTSQPEQSSIPTDPFEGWTASDPITDRGSTFIAFAAKVDSEDDAFMKLQQLKMDHKLQRANHVMSAWRIKSMNDDNNTEIIYQDSDDDGETAAGSRMLHLITIMDVWNVIVVVARWFGGVHIGPSRFKHINSTAREAVIRAGFETNNKK